MRARMSAFSTGKDIAQTLVIIRLNCALSISRSAGDENHQYSGIPDQIQLSRLVVVVQIHSYAVPATNISTVLALIMKARSEISRTVAVTITTTRNTVLSTALQISIGANKKTTTVDAKIQRAICRFRRPEKIYT